MFKKINKITFSIIIFSFIVSPICLGVYDGYVWSNMSDLSQPVSATVSDNYVDDTSNPLNLDCGSAILIEQTTGKGIIFI